jgi:hypothetical protein
VLLIIVIKRGCFDEPYFSAAVGHDFNDALNHRMYSRRVISFKLRSRFGSTKRNSHPPDTAAVFLQGYAADAAFPEIKFTGL